MFKGTQLAKQLPKPPGGGGYKGPKGVLDPKKASEEKNGEGKKLRSPAHRYLFGRKLFALGRRPSGNLSRLYNFWLTQAENISKDDRPELELKHLAITQGTQSTAQRITLKIVNIHTNRRTKLPIKHTHQTSPRLLYLPFQKRGFLVNQNYHVTGRLVTTNHVIKAA